MNICTFSSCERNQSSKGLCTGHYSQQYRGEELRALRPRRTRSEVEQTASWVERPGSTPKPGCNFEGCRKPHSALGLCKYHAAQQRRGAKLGDAADLRLKRKSRLKVLGSWEPYKK